MEKCKLRALEPTDIHFLYELENQEYLWEISQTQLPFSKHLLIEYLNNAKQDIYEAKQFRYGIESIDNHLVGCIDLYDFDPKNRRACVGIAILKSYQQQGFAEYSLHILIEYSRKYFNLHQLIAYIPEDNIPSRSLFEKIGFVSYGIKKDWILSNGVFKNVNVYQLFL